MEFTQAEAEKKAQDGQRVRVRLDGAFSRTDLKEGMTGKVYTAEPSPYLRAAQNAIWAVSIEFDDASIPAVQHIHKEEYQRYLEEI